ncbi:hypothetical protein [Paenibacillus bovis]|uniref:Uncharacterized protein n=1 Tax=Paenibacillus bovis TaxID=1616788 RepID=A0A172ZLB7_9BACL|nr:hypothetical protein [Paenibacillus bovis]ANF97930.1 hypothetical protein AR543_19175 [Paenibacillus bovis]
MARTQTQKAIRKALRSGSIAPTLERRSNQEYAAISQHTRITPSKQERMQKIKHKKQILRDDASFFMPFIPSSTYGSIPVNQIAESPVYIAQ